LFERFRLLGKADLWRHFGAGNSYAIIVMDAVGYVIVNLGDPNYQSINQSINQSIGLFRNGSQVAK